MEGDAERSKDEGKNDIFVLETRTHAQSRVRLLNNGLESHSIENAVRAKNVMPD
jgi:hypothetical protein